MVKYIHTENCLVILRAGDFNYLPAQRVDFSGVRVLVILGDLFIGDIDFLKANSHFVDIRARWVQHLVFEYLYSRPEVTLRTQCYVHSYMHIDKYALLEMLEKPCKARLDVILLMPQDQMRDTSDTVEWLNTHLSVSAGVKVGHLGVGGIHLLSLLELGLGFDRHSGVMLDIPTRTLVLDQFSGRFQSDLIYNDVVINSPNGYITYPPPCHYLFGCWGESIPTEVVVGDEREFTYMFMDYVGGVNVLLPRDLPPFGNLVLEGRGSETPHVKNLMLVRQQRRSLMTLFVASPYSPLGRLTPDLFHEVARMLG